MSKIFQAVLWIAGVLIFLVLALPAIAGYGYAVIMLPADDQSASCEDRKADPIRGDDYRVYLLNRGCSVREAMESLGKDLNVDPNRLMDFYRGVSQPAGSDQFSAWDAAKASLHLPKFQGDLCMPNCLPPGVWGDDTVGRMFDRASQKYFEVATPLFLGALATGASHMAGIMQQGPLAQGLLYIGYIIGLGILASALYDLLKRAVK